MTTLRLAEQETMPQPLEAPELTLPVEAVSSFDIDACLSYMVKIGASDMHLKAPGEPRYRIDGKLLRNRAIKHLQPDEVEKAFDHITTKAQRTGFLLNNELDFCYNLPGTARFRVNVHRQRGNLSLAFRLIPFNIPSIEDLGLPAICKDLIMKPRGLILVTGPTGSGKSTTLAALIQYRNTHSQCRIITIEDPIEYIFEDEECVISQRELGNDTASFAEALKHALRHDPDVIVVGEMRDLETMTTAIAAAETGHLVLGTLHTVDVTQSVDRLIDSFPATQQPQVRLQLSQLLEAIISQTLLPLASGKGRAAAFEVMLMNTAVRNVIRDGKTFELAGIIQLNQASGMQLLDQDLANLVRAGKANRADALEKSSRPERLTKVIDDPNFLTKFRY